MFPDVESEDGSETVGDGIIGAGVLADGQCAGGISLKPDPARAKEGGAFLDEFGFEGGEGPPLLDDLGAKGRFLDFGFAFARNDRGGPKLGKLEIVIQSLAGAVEDGAGRMADDVFQCHGLELCAGNEFVQVVYIPFQVLAMVEFKGSGANDGVQCVYRVR